MGEVLVLEEGLVRATKGDNDSTEKFLWGSVPGEAAWKPTGT